jgi:hypothetical protein
MASSFLNGILRRLDDLSDDDLLEVHREVCRRAERIYRPLYKAKRDANHATGMWAARGRRG